jgi:acyl carrier protein phosphodiesterase
MTFITQISMNWLAHTLLSIRDIDYQLGNVLADPLKGRAWHGAKKAIEQGMMMHKVIDKFTDKHHLVTESKARLGRDGHLKGVVLDLLHDHFLSQNWGQFCAWSLDEYLTQFNGKAFQASTFYPPKPQRIVSKMSLSNLLGQYQTFEGFIQALCRIDQRLSERAKVKETASQYIGAVEQNYPNLQDDFLQFFPELADHFKNHSLGSQTNHFLL